MRGNKGGHTPSKYCIIHGHFYQPPRENPWINRIQRQPSAAPYHDWNERIYDECYRPNAYSRILDPKGMIQDIHNNYTNLSFNFGPTLLMWLEDNHPVVTQRIIDADAESCRRLHRHGNAIAQVYNHIIMPLASRRDQKTQIRWGASFFRSRFGRDTEGMWLAETAINSETVLCLIEEGIRFVILSPDQAEAFRPLDSDTPWRPVQDNALDTRQAYRIYPYTKKGKREEGFLDVFFFNEGLSRAASFEDLLGNAETCANRINASFSKKATGDETVVIATDGETFGHHRPFGDMCLAYFFTHTTQTYNIEPVNFGYVLSKNHPRFELKLKNASGEGTSWSCVHGTGRWIRDCGCQTGGRESWNQKWRTSLRDALVTLQQHIDLLFENTLGQFVQDPWAVRDAYEPYHKEYTLDGIQNLVITHGEAAAVEIMDVRSILTMLEAQKYMLYAFTSCGWFFADISGIETLQNLCYAGRAIQLACNADCTADHVQRFLSLLDTARSNIGKQTGKTLFEHEAVPAMKHLQILCFTAAVYRLVFHTTQNPSTHYGYTISLQSIISPAETTSQAEVFCAHIDNPRTGESEVCSVLLLHENTMHLRGYVLPFDITKDKDFTIHNIEQWKTHQHAIRYTLADLFTESKDAFSTLFAEQLQSDTIIQFTAWVEKHTPVLKALITLHTKLPEYLHGLLSYVINTQWNNAMEALEEGRFSDEQFLQLRSLYERSQEYGISIDFSASIPTLQSMLLQEIQSFAETLSPASCDRMRYLLNIVDRFSIPLPKSRLEDTFYDIYSTTIRQLYATYCSNKHPTPEQKTLILQIVNFARRMNFNTDTFQIQ